MISDFNLLATKITELATLTHDLRRDNAALRKQVATLGHDNNALQARIDAAHQRVAGLLQSLPDSVADLHDDDDPPDLSSTDPNTTGPNTTGPADDDDLSDASTNRSETMRQSL
jgi:cell division protein ZapB